MSCNGSHIHTRAHARARILRRSCCFLKRVRVETGSGGTRRRTGGEVKGKEANGLGSQQSSAWLGTVHPVLLQSFSIDPHSKKASTRMNWHPRRYKWTRPFRWKTESSFCACAITFRLHSTYNAPLLDLYGADVRMDTLFMSFIYLNGEFHGLTGFTGRAFL